MAQSMTDCELLNSYVEAGKQQAFAEIVGRHAGWVKGAALRQVPEHMVDDVTQAVFVLMARKAATLRFHQNLGGWLFEVMRNCASDARKGQSRRVLHEREAATMCPQQTVPVDDQAWGQIAPEIDSAVAALKKADRDVILRRFYQRQPLRVVGESLGIGEDAARKRVDRVLEKLRFVLEAKGISPGSAGLSSVLGVHLCQNASPALVAAITGAAGQATGVAAELAAAVSKAMLMGKMKAAAGVLGVILAAAAIVVPLARQRMVPVAQSAPTAVVSPVPAAPLPAEAVPPSTRRVGSITAIPPTMVIPEPQQGQSGRRVKVASKLDGYGVPVLIDAPVRYELVTTELPANDARTVPLMEITGGPMPLAAAIDAVGQAAGLDLRSTSMDLTQEPWKSTTVQFEAARMFFWEAIQTLCEKGGLTCGKGHLPTKSLVISSFEGQFRLSRQATPWGIVSLSDVNRITYNFPPPWTHRDVISVIGWYQPDPSVKVVVVYPAKIWAEGKLGGSTDHQPQIADWRGGRQIGFYVPESRVKGGVIKQVKGVLPLKLVHRTRIFEAQMTPGANVVVSIDGFIVHFFGMTHSGDDVTLSYGMIRQSGQSAEAFAPFLIECELWLNQLSASGGDGQWSPVSRSSGRGGNGDSMVWEAHARVPAGNGPVTLRWEIPAVVQRADLAFSFDQVEVP